MSRWRDYLREGRSIGRSLRRSTDSLVGSLTSASRQTAKTGRRMVDATARKLSEDSAAILGHSPIAASILAHRASFEADPQVFSRLYNVRVRPIVAAAALTSVGVGASAFDEVLSKLTRHVFDGDQLVGGWLGERIVSIAGPEHAEAINRFMDTVPGASQPGGGWLHRIQHGHDLEAVAEIWSEHGASGAVQAVYHILGRDFFTPAGIPVLPAGSDAVQDYLTKTLGLGQVQAADLISLNFVELLGGTLSVVGILRLGRALKGARENAIIRSQVREAERAVEQEDFLTAAELAERAATKRPGDPALMFFKAAIHHRAGNHVEAHAAYYNAAQLMAGVEPTIDVGGAKISFRGIAAAAALATSDALARTEDHRAHWSKRVSEIARMGLTGFETVADRLLDRRVIKRFGEGSILPPRYASAALNYYLAGQLAGGALVLSDRDTRLTRAAERFDECLGKVLDLGLACGVEAEIAFMRRFVRAQLLPPTALPSNS